MTSAPVSELARVESLELVEASHGVHNILRGLDRCIIRVEPATVAAN